MIKKNVIISIITTFIVSVFLAGCRNATDDAARIIGKRGEDIVKPLKNQGDQVIENLDSQGNKLSRIASEQSEKVLKRCKSEAKNAVKAIKRQSITEISQDYLIQEAKDTAQKCAVGGLGDFMLDQLANDAVTEVEQESQSESENEFSN